MIISSSQNGPPELERFHYDRPKTEEIIGLFKRTAAGWEEDNRKRFGDDSGQWEPPVKILIVCDKLLTGFDAPIEQVMYLDKPLRDHNLLQAIARTNRPFPELEKRNGLVIDYLNVFKDLQKALNFDESVREEAVIDWEKLKEQVPIEIGRCMAPFYGIKIQDTLCLRLPHGTDVDRKKTIESWLRREARKDILQRIAAHKSDMRVELGNVYIMGQRTKWGGCSRRKNLSFNWRLVMAPPAVLDYIVVHELAHLIEPYHSAKFWLIVRSYHPDFEQHKEWLKTNEWHLNVPQL